MTVLKSILLILSFNSFLTINVFANSESYKLEQVIALFRHGDRAPTTADVYEDDPYDEIYQKIGYGQLTKIGKKREYKIGKFLRKRYDSFLGEYDNDVYAYSTDLDRTKMSLQLVLAGLYPPGPSTSWSNSLDWQPIPTHYEDWDNGFMSAIYTCPRFEKLYREVANTPEMLQVFHEHEDLFQRITNNTGVTISQLFTILNIYSNLRSALSLGFPLPAWCSKEDFTEIEKIAGLGFKAMTYTEQLRRMFAGPVVEQFVKVLKENDESKKIHLYSGHEFNVAAFIDAHNITGAPIVQDYGSTIVIEKLRGLDHQIYIRVYLWTGVTEKFIPLKIPQCKKTCLLSDYEKIVQTILPNQASRVCQATSLCKRRLGSNKTMDLDMRLARLFAGSDLASFKYMKDFVIIEKS